MFEYDIVTGTGYLLIAVVVGIVAEEWECVTLVHLHITEGLKGVGGLVEIGTVAIEPCPLMGEVHLAIKDSSIGIDPLVVMKHVGVDEIDAGVLNLRLAGGALRLSFLGLRFTKW